MWISCSIYVASYPPEGICCGLANVCARRYLHKVTSLWRCYIKNWGKIPATLFTRRHPGTTPKSISLRHHLGEISFKTFATFRQNLGQRCGFTKRAQRTFGSFVLSSVHDLRNSTARFTTAVTIFINVIAKVRNVANLKKPENTLELGHFRGLGGVVKIMFQGKHEAED